MHNSVNLPGSLTDLKDSGFEWNDMNVEKADRRCDYVLEVPTNKALLTGTNLFSDFRQRRLVIQPQLPVTIF